MADKQTDTDLMRKLMRSPASEASPRPIPKVTETPVTSLQEYEKQGLKAVKPVPYTPMEVDKPLSPDQMYRELIREQPEITRGTSDKDVLRQILDITSAPKPKPQHYKRE